MTGLRVIGNVDGLSSAEARHRLEVNGPNLVPRPAPPSTLSRVVRQLRDPLVALLVVALVVTIAVGDLTDAAIIAVVVIANTAIGVVQEARADRAIAALDAVAAPTARVSRDGADASIPAAELVVGDRVHLEAGDVVPADMRVKEANRLRLDESALTGESVAVGREAGDEAHAGTVVVTGRAVGVVIRTGASSGLGRIAAAVARTRPGPTPLQRRLTELGRMLGLLVVVLSAVVFTIGVVRGEPVVQMAITAVSLVVAAVPESLPAVVTLALALAARRMAARRAIPRRLHSVETLGSVTVVASDKTGTLTEGRMTVGRAVDAADIEYSVSGRGYAPDGTVTGPDGHAGAPPALRELARAALLCNDAALVPPSRDHPQWRTVGDPLEGALLAFAGRCGLNVEAERSAAVRVAERPFDAATRRMTTVHRIADGRRLTICKGAPEAVLVEPVLAHVPAGAREAAARLAEAGLRVLAVGVGESQRSATAEPTPFGLRFLGLVGIGDPVRAEAPAIARTFDEAGIRLMLVTGDHPGTASSIGESVGIWHTGDPVHHGDVDEARANELADSVRVFARVAPEQKLNLISALQQRGHVVAMTGDGVNDAPALRRADVGVAMGGGTEVARQAADLVLVDDNLATMATAVHEGRRIYANIRRFLLYGLSGGAAELVVMLVGPVLGLALPLLPAQILWINLLTHGVPGVALGAEPAEPGIMHRPPRPPQQSVLGGRLARSVVGIGLLLAAVALAVGVLGSAAGRPWQSMLFVVLGLGQLGIALALRARRSPGGDRNAALPVALGLAALLQLAGVAVAPLRELLGTTPITLVDFAWCLVAATVPALVVFSSRSLRSRSRHTA